MRASRTPPPIALTMGDPAAIGGEIALAAWRARRGGVAPFVLIDDPERIARLSRRIGLDVPVHVVATVEEATAAFDKGLPILPLTIGVEIEPGRPDPAAGPAILESIEIAVRLTQAGRTAAVVTNPIHKAALYRTGFSHPGHTEFLAALAGAHAAPVMMLACDKLRVVPVTIHLALAEAIARLTTEAIVHAGAVTLAALRSDFGIAQPRLAVAGLNPHAGESGFLGRQEIDVIAPAIEQLRRRGANVQGPLPADTMFHDRARAGYDAALCMYHDQALIPLKTLDFSGGVNVTLGLPFVRTSPDHGTAFDIAGTGQADPTSLIAALRLAGEMAAMRAARLDAVPVA